MKQFDLQEYLKKPQRKIVTRNGDKIRIICTDKKSSGYPIVALLEYSEENNTNKEAVIFYNEKSKINLCNNNVDLFFASEKKEGWINLYKDGNKTVIGNVYPFESEELAKKAMSDKDYIATCKIEWEE